MHALGIRAWTPLCEILTHQVTANIYHTRVQAAVLHNTTHPIGLVITYISYQTITSDTTVASIMNVCIVRWIGGTTVTSDN